MGGVPVGFEGLSRACAEVGVELGRIGPALLARLQLLASVTGTMRDALHIVEMARAVFQHYAMHKARESFTDSEKRAVVIGSLLADIGKTGPLRATVGQQLLIAEMFSVEGVLDDRQPVAAFLHASFPNDADARVAQFRALGLDPQMALRTFWNLHAGWTLEIVRSDHVPEEAIAAAASHHLLENVNPEGIVEQDGHFSVPFGDNTMFDRAEKLVILLDKYDAIRRRSRGTHEQAITWLRARLDAHPVFRGDAEFTTLLADLDAVLHP